MTRTYRNTENSGYFTKPKTLNYKKGLIRTKQEIYEELGPNYLGGNTKDYKNIITAWEDKYISAREETLTFIYYMERIFDNKLKSIYKYAKEDYLLLKSRVLKIDFNKNKNRFEIGKYTYYVRKYDYNNAIYLPFNIKYKRVYYPVIILMHEWYRP